MMSHVRRDLVDRIRTPELDRCVVAFTRAGYDIRLAGGVVRDLLAGQTPKDVDLAVDAPAGKIAETAVAAGFKSKPTGLHHGTLTIVVDGAPFEITAYRLDPADKPAKPMDEQAGTIESDARHRDFTINAMYLDLDGDLYDPYEGRRDLRDGRIRFVDDDPDARIAEDPVRMLRFYRFDARYGSGGRATARDAPETYDAIRRNAGRLANVARERIRDEVLSILSGPNAATMIDRMAETGVLKMTALDRLDRPALTQAAATMRDPVCMLAWASPCQDAFEERAGGFWLSNDQTKRGRMAYSNRDIGLFSPSRAYDAVVDGIPAPVVGDLLRAAGHLDEAEAIEAWTPPVFPISGRDLYEAGVPKGPEIGRRLKQAHHEWKRSRYEADADELVRRVTDDLTPRPR